MKASIHASRLTILGQLEQFLARHSASEDLGLRLDGEQLAAGVRFLRIIRERQYHVVAGNPPFFGTQPLAKTGCIDRCYQQSRENLCTALLDRAMELMREGGQAERGPPAPDDRTSRREVDARFVMDLDDGVRVNSAALWPLLEPQWKDPQKWWVQVASRRGPKGVHFDWSRTARRYFPERVARACEQDPILASAHGCLWEHHPELAHTWELRLRRKLNSDFVLTEAGANERRLRFFQKQANAIRELGTSGAGQKTQIASKKRAPGRVRRKP
ncbi:hypothetical protein ACFL5O_06900 [Myxococcota bacterium]